MMNLYEIELEFYRRSYRRFYPEEAKIVKVIY